MSLPVISELERAIGVLSHDLLRRSAIRLPRFVIQPDRKAAFQFIGEFNYVVVGEGFIRLPIMSVPLELLHELSHIFNHVMGRADCTTNQYHNRRFLETALSLGLYVGRHATRGWCLTSLRHSAGYQEPHAQALEKRVACVAGLQLNSAVLLSGKQHIRGLLQQRAPRRACFLKYVCDCPPPHNSIRSGRRPGGENPLRVRCENCGGLFRCVEAS